jgi:hypothetical protein
MRITLRAKSFVLEQVLELVWEDEVTIIVSASAEIHDMVTRTIEEGLSEWVGKDPNTRCRTTPSTSSAFLLHLADYIRRQFDLIVELDYD